jgi:hypothetical protein
MLLHHNVQREAIKALSVQQDRETIALILEACGALSAQQRPSGCLIYKDNMLQHILEDIHMSRYMNNNYILQYLFLK